MMATAIRDPRIRDVRSQYREQRRTVLAAYGGLLLAALFFAQIIRIYGPGLAMGFVALCVIGAIALVRPQVALGIAIVAAIIGDTRAMPWWPAVKNLSSVESLLYVNDRLTVNPFELMLVGIAAVWVASRLLTLTRPPLQLGELANPLALFAATVIFGLAWGLSRGGDTRVAIFEARPLLYIPLVYLLVTNLFTTPRSFHRLLWGIVAGLTFESVYGLVRMSEIRTRVPEDQSPVEHTAALHMNILLILLIATLFYGPRGVGRRLVLLAMAVPVFWLFLASERRAAVIGLIVGIAYISVVLAGRNRARFRRVVPVMALVGVAYVGAFWGVEEGIGFPAQAVKTVIAPSTASAADASSDLYRDIENFNLNYTIRASPLTGIGFGQQFYRPVPLPDISFFEFWAYIPHNSLMWMWTQVGIVGFSTFLYVFGKGAAFGVRAARMARDAVDATLISAFAAYIPMTLIVAFVDITFDVQTTVLLGTSLAVVGSAERIFPMRDLATDAQPASDHRAPVAR